MAGHPIRKEELAALESMARGLDSRMPIEEAILQRLLQMGLVEERRGKWLVTERGRMDLSRRKALKRSQH